MGKHLLKISIINILLNAILDYFLVNSFGAPGLLMATIGVNIISMTVFIAILHRRLNGLPLMSWSKDIAALFLATMVAAFASYGVSPSPWKKNYRKIVILWLLLLELSGFLVRSP